jgi:hypothetical protein
MYTDNKINQHCITSDEIALPMPNLLACKWCFRMKRNSSAAIDTIFFVNNVVSIIGHPPLLVPNLIHIC